MAFTIFHHRIRGLSPFPTADKVISLGCEGQKIIQVIPRFLDDHEKSGYDCYIAIENGWKMMGKW